MCVCVQCIFVCLNFMWEEVIINDELLQAIAEANKDVTDGESSENDLGEDDGDGAGEDASDDASDGDS